MLIRGEMRIGNAEYTLYELKTKKYYRLDIMKKNGEFHVDAESVLFSCYQRGRYREFGDKALHRIYTETINYLLNMPGNATRECKWNNDSFFVADHRGAKGKHHIIKTCDGKWYSERYELDDISIDKRVLIRDYQIALIPLNYRRYRMVSVVDEKNGGSYIPLPMLRKRHNLIWEQSTDYRVAAAIEYANATLRELEIAPDDNPIGFDIVTTECVAFREKTGLIGVVLSHEDGCSFYYPFQSYVFNTLPISYLYDQILPVLRKKTCIVSHNKKYIQNVMDKLGAGLNIHYCSLILSILLNPAIGSMSHSIQQLGSEMRNGQKFLVLSDIFINPQNTEVRLLDRDIMRLYACPGADNCRRFFARRINTLPDGLRKHYDRECGLADISDERLFFWIDRINFDKFGNVLYTG